MSVLEEPQKKIKIQIKIGLAIPIFICANIALIVLTWFYPTSIVPYNLDNYRYIYSALLQVIGSIFAFIASSTLVVLQLLHSNSPNSAKFFPKKIFSSFLIVSLVVLICDSIALINLSNDVSLSKQFILNWLIITNIYPVFCAFIYTLYVIRYLSPKGQVDHIIREATKVRNNTDRCIIVYSLEELFLTAIKGGQGGNIRLYQDTLIQIIDIFTNTRTSLNAKSKYECDHPLRIIPDVIERITFSMIDNDMSNLLHFNGHILRQLCGSKYNGKEIVTVEISTAIRNIAIACLANGQIIDLCNFCANFVIPADESSGLHTIFWGMRDLIEQLPTHPSKKDILKVFSTIIMCFQDLFDKKEVISNPETERMVSFLESQKDLIAICENCGNKSVGMNIRNFRKQLNDLHQTSNNDSAISNPSNSVDCVSSS